MAITAAMVKELRERTGAGMMECKKALVETGGDIEAAIEHMRKAGLAKADKKAGRVAAEGVIAIALSDDGRKVALVEVNSETDFVAKGDEFRDFAQKVAQRALDEAPADVEALGKLPMGDGDERDINTARQEMVTKIGENIQIRRMVRAETDGLFGTYIHGGRIGVAVELKGGDTELARDLAMHVAANKPLCVKADDVPAEVLEKEREIFTAQAKESGKPDNIIEKMVEGRIRKYLQEITLLGQEFVKDPDLTVAKLLEQKGAEVVGFHRLEVGEGIEKKSENFADEVMAQVRGD
ncbi:MAG TPA: elongation factor Ts [Thiotrichales bacterium]|nr:elongation factor Ts [Thiotrichales bacterium]